MMTRGRLQVGAVLLIGALVSFTLFSLVRDWQFAGRRESFFSLAEVRAQALHRAVRYNIEIVYSLRNFFEARDAVTPAEFLAFVAPTLERHRGVRSLRWMTRQGEDSPAIVALASGGPAASLAAPGATVETALVAPLLEAVRNDTLVMTIIRADAPGETASAVVFFLLPIRRGGVVIGCVASECEIDRLMEAALRAFDSDVVNLFFREGLSPESSVLLGAIGPDVAAGEPPPFEWTGHFQAASRSWSIACRPSRAFLAASRSATPWVVLAIGLLLTAAMGVVFARNLGRARAIEEANRRYVEELARRDERMREELGLARVIQRAMLPTDLPEARGLEFGLCFVPSGEVGGDYFDFIPFPDGRIAVVLADISGHGVPAALLFAIFKALAGETFREAAPPAEAFRTLNRRLTKLFPRGRFASTFYALFDPQRRTLTFVKASQEPVLVFRRGRPVERIEDGGVLLGALNPDLFGDPDYAAVTIEVAPGDTFFFFTDGLVEVEDAAGRMLTVEGLIPWLEEDLRLAPQAMVDRIFARTVEYAGAKELRDDFTAIAVRIAEE